MKRVFFAEHKVEVDGNLVSPIEVGYSKIFNAKTVNRALIKIKEMHKNEDVKEIWLYDVQGNIFNRGNYRLLRKVIIGRNKIEGGECFE